jgi:hypothetical protein
LLRNLFADGNLAASTKTAAVLKPGAPVNKVPLSTVEKKRTLTQK